MRIIKSTLNLVFIAFLAYVSSCSKPGHKSDYNEETGHPPSLNREREDALGNNPTASEFAQEAASDGFMEIQMAEIAQQRAQTSQVKELAEMIRQDHLRANDKLKELGIQNNWSIPEDMLARHKQKLKKLESEKPDSFDAQYVKMMIEGHQQAINLFKKMAEKTADPDHSTYADQPDDGVNPQLLDWINETLPVLHKHLERSKKMQDELSKINRS